MKAPARVSIGIGLIILGGIFMLDNLGVISIGPYIWGGLFIVGALFFFYQYFIDRTQWWFVIPAFVLIGVGLTILVSTAFPQAQGGLVGSIILLTIGLAFLVVYFSNRENWWAIIPAGTMLTLSVVVILSEQVEGFGVASIFFIGLGLTFGVLYFIPTSEGRLTWALIPAFILLILGAIVSIGSGALAPYIWPVALILGGLFLIFRTFQERGG